LVEIFLDLSADGLLRHCLVRGHAAGKGKGGNLVCGAVTVLVRTAARTLESCPGLALEGQAREPGDLQFSLPERFPAGLEGWISGVTDSLLTGLLDIQDEYPRECRLTINRQDKE